MNRRETVNQAVVVQARPWSDQSQCLNPLNTRRKKRWKSPGLLTILLVSTAFSTVLEGHVTGNGMMDERNVKSLHSQLRLELDSMGSGSTFELSDSTHLQLQQDESEIVKSDASLNDASRLLRLLQTSFERHFKEELLCDVHDIKFSSESGTIHLEAITLEGCDNLRSLDDIFDIVDNSTLSNSTLEISLYGHDLKNLTVTQSRQLTDIKTSNGFRSLRRLILRHNGINNFELQSIFENLEFVDLSGNPITHFIASDLTNYAPNLKVLVIANCTELKRIDFSSFPAKSSGLLVNLDTLILDDNPRLTVVCPWFLRSAFNMSFVSLNRCPKLDVLPGMFLDIRFFPVLKTLRWEGTPAQCDCALAAPQQQNENATIYVNKNLFQSVRQELDRHNYCRENSTLISIEKFFGDPGKCQDQEFSLSDKNPTLTLSWFDPYAKVDANFTMANETDTYFEEEEEVIDVFEQGVQVWTSVQLDCQLEEGAESIFWVTPTNTIFLIKNKTTDGEFCKPTSAILEHACGQVSTFDNEVSNVRIFPNGTLLITDFGWADRGFYECFVSRGNHQAGYAQLNLTLDHTYRNGIYNLSLIYGFAFSGAFLLLTLMFKLIHFLLHNYGCCLFCCCCENKLPPKARRLKRALDSIEAYRSQQQDKLRENYTQQSDWIRENCASQMERVRENYNSQIQNLKDIRQYGSTQLSAVRGQYYEQMSRIRDYSANQLDRVHENYIFQRQRLRKFSAQNYLRETGVYTKRTLTKVMENIPVLYLDLTTCKQGLGDRQPSIEWAEPDQFLEMEQYSIDPVRRAMLQREQSEHRSESIYFTPTGTPVREVFGSWAGGVQSNSLKNTPTKEIDPYKAVYGPNPTSLGRKSVIPGHRRNRSFSQFLPPLPTWLSSSTSAGFLAGTGNGRGPPRETTINEVEVVIEQETNSNDYYLDSDVSTKIVVDSSNIAALPASSLRRSVSVPSDEASAGKRSLTSSSGVMSMESNNSPHSERPSNIVASDQDPLLHRPSPRGATSSVLYLFPPPQEDSLKQKRLSL